MNDREVEMKDAPTVPKVQVFPLIVPTEDEYPHPTYYVRDCYPVYYELVLLLLQKRRGVTITGTPGIGKSMFMAYFFDRYNKENRVATVMMHSYTRSSELREIVVVKDGKLVESVSFDTPAMKKIVGGYIKNASGECIHLLDGPPSMIPPGQQPWVSFTSPNENWSAMLGKNEETTYTIFMPTWTLQELRDAAAQLGRTSLLERASGVQMQYLGLHPSVNDAGTRDVIDCCFDAFGGVPRLCFSADDKVLRKTFRSMNIAAFALTLDEISNHLYLSYQAVAAHVHRLFHYVPEEYPFETARVRVASVVVKRMMMAREDEIRKNNPELLTTLVIP